MIDVFSRLRHSTQLKHAEAHEQPFKSQGRKILPKGATPSIAATSTDKKVDSVVSEIKAELRIQTYYIDAQLETTHDTALNRGKTSLQGTRASKGWQAAHACLAPSKQDNRTQQAISRVIDAGLTPNRTRPFLEQRIGLTEDDAMVLESNHDNPAFVSQFILQRLPKDGMHSMLSDSRYHWNCNATFENPDESNEYDSRMEKAISKFLATLQTDRLSGIETAESSTEKLIAWLVNYYQESIVNLEQKQVYLSETASLFESMRKFEREHLDADHIPEEAFKAYLQNLELFLNNYDGLIEKKTGCPSVKEIKKIRDDFKFLRKMAEMAFEKEVPTPKIITYYSSFRHLGRELFFDKNKFAAKFALYEEEAKAQMAAVNAYTEPCTIPSLQTALFGTKDGKAMRRAPTSPELKHQLFALSQPATPVRAKIAKKIKIKPIPFPISYDSDDRGLKRANPEGDSLDNRPPKKAKLH